jgi:hypothetical protein
MLINLKVLAGSGGMIVLLLNRVYLETRELNPRSSIFDQRKSQLHNFTSDYLDDNLMQKHFSGKEKCIFSF